LAIFTINLLKEQDYVHVFASHLPSQRYTKFLRDPISVGIDPERELLAVFCGVGNTIEVASNIVSVRDEIGNLHKQSVLKEQDYVHVFACHLQKPR